MILATSQSVQGLLLNVATKGHRLDFLASQMFIYGTSRNHMSSSLAWTMAMLTITSGDKYVSSFHLSMTPRRLDHFTDAPRYHWSLTEQRNRGEELVPIDIGLPSGDTTTTESHATIRGSSAVLSQKPSATNAPHLQMLSFYHFQQIPDPWKSRNELFASIQSIEGLRGTIYVAKEGINGQLAVPPGQPLDQLLQECSTALPFDPFVDCPPNLGDLVPIETPTFNRLIVRVRDFILRDGITTPNDRNSSTSLQWNDAGQELSPAEWHDQLQMSSQEEETTTPPVLLDCRNLYESQEGTFRGAIPLATQTFQESWPILDSLTQDMPRDKPLHIFCTGGIRCVKVGAYLKQQLGFQNVRRLQHGIIGYEKWIQSQQQQQGKDKDDPTTTTSTKSLWEGNNFLFDKRRIASDGGSDDDPLGQ